MEHRVAIVGVGRAGFRPLTPDVSYKEMMFEAATRAYTEAGINPRKDVGSFVCCSEDFEEGTAIFDEYVPDQLGALLKPVHTVCADGLFGVIAAYMQIATGLFDMVVVEAHSKASNVLTPVRVMAMALDPVWNRPLGQNPYFVAGMEMNRYLHLAGASREDCAEVVVRNKKNALANPWAACGAALDAADVLASEMLFDPLTRLDMSPPLDGAVVVVLASEDRARLLHAKPVWLKGVGWCSDSPALEGREWGEATYARLAAEMAYRTAGIESPRREIDLFEVDDTFSYKELQHLEALGLCRRGEAASFLREASVNASGGSLGVGHLWEAAGLERLAAVVGNLRGGAGRTGLAQAWRGVPTATGAVVILSRSPEQSE